MEIFFRRASLVVFCLRGESILSPLFFILLTSILCAVGYAKEAELGAELEGLLHYAREHNPELAAMRYEAQAATERIRPAAAFSDPILRVEWMDVGAQTEEGNSTRYTWMQHLPWFGKRPLKRAVAAAGAEAAEGRVIITWTELSKQIKLTYAHYYFITENQRITQDLLDLLVRMEQIAEVRYANGLAAEQDVVRAKVEQTVLKTELVMLQNTRRQLEVTLNALLSRPVTLSFAIPERLRGIPEAVHLKNYALLEKQMREKNPDLWVNTADIRMSEKNRKLVYKNRYPDVTLGVFPTELGRSKEEWGVMFELNIPLQQTARRAEEREAEALLAAANARKEATINRILSLLAEKLSGIDTAGRTLSLGNTELLPQAKITFESALIGYQTGKVDFATLLDAARQVLNAKLVILKAKTEAETYLAEVERLLGEDLS